MMLKEEIEKEIGTKIPNKVYWNAVLGLAEFHAESDDIYNEIKKYWIFRNDKYLSSESKDFLLKSKTTFDIAMIGVSENG